jgi:hypothetical protein
VVHPQRGATSTNSSSSLLSSVNLLTCTEPQNQLRIGQEICVHLARSSFPELGHNTKPSYTVCTQASYNHLHLALQVLTHSMHKASSSALSHSTRSLYYYFLTSPRYLFIHYKWGLNMGKPMGRHPIPVT